MYLDDARNHHYAGAGAAAAERRESDLLDDCSGHGSFHWRAHGEPNAAKQRVFVLRAGLNAAFGPDDDPFHESRVVDGRRARFFASSEIGADER